MSAADRVSSAPNRGSAFAAAFFEELERAGVAHVCICPGSRSGPLAIAAAGSRLRRWTHLDERSAAFFALGLAKATRHPVALLCTSGTAAANFLPAVVEAHYARVPLLVLTADRPPELRDWGAGQTIDQVQLFGSHVRWFADAAAPAASPERLRYARALAARACEVARGGPAGPVHLNLPFRDPLDPRPVAGDVPADLASRDALAAHGRGDRPFATLHPGRVQPDASEIAALGERLRRVERGVVVCGPMDAPRADAQAIARLAARLGWPLIAEPTSGLRSGPQPPGTTLIAGASWILGDERFGAEHRPDFVLRFGAAPTHKGLARWIEAAGEQLTVDPDALWHDPAHRVSEIHRAAPEAFCTALGEALPERAGSGWLEAFQRADAAARTAVALRLEDEAALLEPRVAFELVAALPAEACLYVSNSMPVRDLDAGWHRAEPGPRVLCNRGANGIDGMVSSALGAAAAGTPVLLFTGDLALLHDTSGLLAAQRLGLPLTVVVVDNDGGGIFSMLPVAAFGREAAFEEHFHTPHGHDLQALCRGMGLAATRVSSWEHFRSELKEATTGAAPRVVIVPTRTDASVAQRRSLADATRGALESLS